MPAKRRPNKAGRSASSATAVTPVTPPAQQMAATQRSVPGTPMAPGAQSLPTDALTITATSDGGRFNTFPQFGQIGRTGLLSQAGTSLSVASNGAMRVFNPDQISLAEYDEMSLYPIIRSCLLGYALVLQTATLNVSCPDASMKALIESQLLPILPQLIRETFMPAQIFGWGTAETVWETRYNVPVTLGASAAAGAGTDESQDVADSPQTIIPFVTAIRDFVPLNNATLTLRQTPKGEFAGAVQWAWGQEFLPPSKLFHLPMGGLFRNPYGQASTKPCYPFWVWARFLFEMCMVAVERGASPPLIGRYPANLRVSAGVDQNGSPQTLDAGDFLLTQLGQLRSFATAVFPRQLDPQGHDLYDVEELPLEAHVDWMTQVIQECHSQMMLGMFFPDKLLQSGDVGSYALAKEHTDLFSLAVKSRLDEFLFYLNQGPVKQFVKFNDRKCPDATITYSAPNLEAMQAFAMAAVQSMVTGQCMVGPNQDKILVPDWQAWADELGLSYDLVRKTDGLDAFGRPLQDGVDPDAQDAAGAQGQPPPDAGIGGGGFQATDVPTGQLSPSQSMRQSDEAALLSDLVTPTPAPPSWKPSMSQSEADEWAKGSSHPQTFYHATTHDAAQKIMREGFSLKYHGANTNTAGMMGAGVYATDQKHLTGPGYGKAQTTLPIKVNVRNPLNWRWNAKDQSLDQLRGEKADFWLRTSEGKDREQQLDRPVPERPDLKLRDLYEKWTPAQEAQYRAIEGDNFLKRQVWSDHGYDAVTHTLPNGMIHEIAILDPKSATVLHDHELMHKTQLADIPTDGVTLADGDLPKLPPITPTTAHVLGAMKGKTATGLDAMAQAHGGTTNAVLHHAQTMVGNGLVHQVAPAAEGKPAQFAMTDKGEQTLAQHEQMKASILQHLGSQGAKSYGELKAHIGGSNIAGAFADLEDEGHIYDDPDNTGSAISITGKGLAHLKKTTGDDPSKVQPKALDPGHAAYLDHLKTGGPQPTQDSYDAGHSFTAQDAAWKAGHLTLEEGKYGLSSQGEKALTAHQAAVAQEAKNGAQGAGQGALGQTSAPGPTETPATHDDANAEMAGKSFHPDAKKKLIAAVDKGMTQDALHKTVAMAVAGKTAGGGTKVLPSHVGLALAHGGDVEKFASSHPEVANHLPADVMGGKLSPDYADLLSQLHWLGPHAWSDSPAMDHPLTSLATQNGHFAYQPSSDKYGLTPDGEKALAAHNAAKSEAKDGSASSNPSMGDSAKPLLLSPKHAALLQHLKNSGPVGGGTLFHQGHGFDTISDAENAGHIDGIAGDYMLNRVGEKALAAHNAAQGTTSQDAQSPSSPSHLPLLQHIAAYQDATGSLGAPHTKEVHQWLPGQPSIAEMGIMHKDALAAGHIKMGKPSAQGQMYQLTPEGADTVLSHPNPLDYTKEPSPLDAIKSHLAAHPGASADEIVKATTGPITSTSKVLTALGALKKSGDVVGNTGGHYSLAGGADGGDSEAIPDGWVKDGDVVKPHADSPHMVFPSHALPGQYVSSYDGGEDSFHENTTFHPTQAAAIQQLQSKLAGAGGSAAPGQGPTLPEGWTKQRNHDDSPIYAHGDFGSGTHTAWVSPLTGGKFASNAKTSFGAWQGQQTHDSLEDALAHAHSALQKEGLAPEKDHGTPTTGNASPEKDHGFAPSETPNSPSNDLYKYKGDHYSNVYPDFNGSGKWIAYVGHKTELGAPGSTFTPHSSKEEALAHGSQALDDIVAKYGAPTTGDATVSTLPDGWKPISTKSDKGYKLVHNGKTANVKPDPNGGGWQTMMHDERGEISQGPSFPTKEEAMAHAEGAVGKTANSSTPVADGPITPPPGWDVDSGGDGWSKYSTDWADLHSHVYKNDDGKYAVHEYHPGFATKFNAGVYDTPAEAFAHGDKHAANMEAAKTSASDPDDISSMNADWAPSPFDKDTYYKHSADGTDDHGEIQKLSNGKWHANPWGSKPGVAPTPAKTFDTAAEAIAHLNAHSAALSGQGTAPVPGVSQSMAPGNAWTKSGGSQFYSADGANGEDIGVYETGDGKWAHTVKDSNGDYIDTGVHPTRTEAFTHASKYLAPTAPAGGQGPQGAAQPQSKRFVTLGGIKYPLTDDPITEDDVHKVLGAQPIANHLQYGIDVIKKFISDGAITTKGQLLEAIAGAKAWGMGDGNTGAAYGTDVSDFMNAHGGKLQNLIADNPNAAKHLEAYSLGDGATAPSEATQPQSKGFVTLGGIKHPLTDEPVTEADIHKVVGGNPNQHFLESALSTIKEYINDGDITTKGQLLEAIAGAKAFGKSDGNTGAAYASDISEFMDLHGGKLQNLIADNPNAAKHLEAYSLGDGTTDGQGATSGGTDVLSAPVPAGHESATHEFADAAMKGGAFHPDAKKAIHAAVDKGVTKEQLGHVLLNAILKKSSVNGAKVLPSHVKDALANLSANGATGGPQGGAQAGTGASAKPEPDYVTINGQKQVLSNKKATSALTNSMPPGWNFDAIDAIKTAIQNGTIKTEGDFHKAVAIAHALQSHYLSNAVSGGIASSAINGIKDFSGWKNSNPVEARELGPHSVTGNVGGKAPVPAPTQASASAAPVATPAPVVKTTPVPPEHKAMADSTPTTASWPPPGVVLSGANEPPFVTVAGSKTPLTDKALTDKHVASTLAAGKYSTKAQDIVKQAVADGKIKTQGDLAQALAIAHGVNKGSPYSSVTGYSVQKGLDAGGVAALKSKAEAGDAEAQGHAAALDPHNILSPKEEEAAKLAAMTGDDVMASAKGSSHGGGNGGGEYTDKNGLKWYVKANGGGKSQNHSEALSNSIYNALGLTAPQSKLFDKDGTSYHATPWMDTKGELGKVGVTPSLAREALKGFAADVLLGNRDVTGYGHNNMLVGHDGKSIVRVDNGAGLLWRALGDKKDAVGLNQIREWSAFADPKVNKEYAALFNKAGIQSADEIPGIEKQLQAISDLGKKTNNFKDIVDQFGSGMSAADKKATLGMLQKRAALLEQKRQDILHAKYGKYEAIKQGYTPHKSNQEGADWTNQHFADQRMKATSAEKSAAHWWQGGTWASANQSLFKGNLADLDSSQKKHIKTLDALVKKPQSTTHPAVVLHRGFGLNQSGEEGLKKEYEDFKPGDEFTVPGYTAASYGTSPGYQSSHGFRWHVHVPAGTGLIHIDGLQGNAATAGGERELMPNRGAKYRVLSNEHDGNQWVQHVELIGYEPQPGP